MGISVLHAAGNVVPSALQTLVVGGSCCAENDGRRAEGGNSTKLNLCLL